MARFLLQSLTGGLGERLGCRYLKEKGYTIIETNYCNTSGKRLGEIDIVAKKGGKLFFVEVKTRLVSGESDVFPEENITREKLRKLERIALHYLREHRLVDYPYSFDALAILYDSSQKKAKIRHLESIFL